MRLILQARVPNNSETFIGLITIFEKMCILQHTSLKSYFQSENFSDERFKGLDEKFRKTLLDPAVLFLSLHYTYLPISACSCNKKSLQFIAKSAMKSLDKTLT